MVEDGLAVDALGLLGEEFDEAGGIVDLAEGLGQRLALLAGHDQRQVVGVLDHQVEPSAQDPGALLGALRPGRQRAVGGLDGRSRLGLADARHLGDDVAGGLVGDGQLGLAGPLAVDVALASDQADGGLVHERLHSMEPAIRRLGQAQRRPNASKRAGAVLGHR